MGQKREISRIWGLGKDIRRIRVENSEPVRDWDTPRNLACRTLMPVSILLAAP